MGKQRPVHNVPRGELGTMLKNNSKEITLRMRLTGSLTLHLLIFSYGYFATQFIALIMVTFLVLVLQELYLLLLPLLRMLHAILLMVITKNVVIHFRLS